MRDSRYEPIAPGDMLTIAGCRRPVDTNPATGQQMTPVDMIRYGLDNGFFDTTTRTNITDQNNTLMWPADIYYQPLTGVP